MTTNDPNGAIPLEIMTPGEERRTIGQVPIILRSRVFLGAHKQVAKDKLVSPQARGTNDGGAHSSRYTRIMICGTRLVAALCARRRRAIFADDACSLYAERDACRSVGGIGLRLSSFYIPGYEPTFSGIARLSRSRKTRISCISR